MGEDYQRHLRQVFDEQTQSILAQDKRKGLALAAEIAVIKDEIVQSDLLMLRQLVAESSLPHAPGPDWRVMQFKLLGCQIDGALTVERRDASGQVQRVLLYLPDAPGRSLFGFDSWVQLNTGLALDLRRTDIDGYFRQRVSLGQLPGFLKTLGQRLADSSPDLEPTGLTPTIDIFDSLAAHQVWRIKDDARKILVPTADADHAASRQRIEALQGVGLILVNVAGLFVPVVGGCCWRRRPCKYSRKLSKACVTGLVAISTKPWNTCWAWLKPWRSGSR
ncbi:hypothetical protein D9M71_373850 [compost metagenome]